MIAALVLFGNGDGIPQSDAVSRFETTAPNYRGRAGLHAKAYIYAEDGADLGGFYLWESREAAEAVYTDEWKAKAATLYGTPPDIRYFDVPVFIDNLSPTKEAR
ncbi:MAG: hypothetical protein V9F06_14140 [Thermomicrobiales bacterium]|jgi:hypothetical protein